MENKKEQDIELEDYEGYKDIDDDNIDESDKDIDTDYTKFNTPNDFDIDEDFDDGNDLALDANVSKTKGLSYENNPGLYTFLKWFGRIGIVIALILVVYYISVGNYLGLFLFALLLVGSYYCGYFLISALDK